MLEKEMMFKKELPERTMINIFLQKTTKKAG